MAVPQNLAFLSIPSVGHFLGLYSPPPPVNSFSSENSSSCGPLPHQLSRWEGKSCHKFRRSELAACKSLNSRTEEEVGFGVGEK